MVKKRSIAHFMLLLWKEGTIIIISLGYMHQAQSLIDSYESQAIIAMKINQSVYLNKYFCPDLKIYCTQQQHYHQINSSWIIKIFEYIVCRTKNITASNVLPLNTDTVHKYHPPKHSSAYYFSKSGNRIRKVRT